MYSDVSAFIHTETIRKSNSAKHRCIFAAR